VQPDVDTHRPPPVVLADGRGPRAQTRSLAHRLLVRLAAGTLLALLTLGAAGWLASGSLAEREALLDVRALAELTARTAVEPSADRLADSDPTALATLDDVVRGHLLTGTPVRRVKLWTADGRILYSDVPQLVGRTFPLSDDQREVLVDGVTTTEVSDLERDENRFEVAPGHRLIEVYTPVRTDGGRELLLELYVRADLVQQRQSDVVGALTWVALLSLGAFGAAQLWLASTSVRWARRERARMTAETARADEDRRRQLARDLHDGVVQDLLGTALQLRELEEPLRASGRPGTLDVLRRAEVSLRTGVRSLRSTVITIYPASLRRAGLQAALADLTAPLQARGVVVELDLPDDPHLPARLETAVHRAAAEALRNAARHADPTRVELHLSVTDHRVRLAVRDDGAGFDPARPPVLGHIGLPALADDVDALGGVLTVASAPGRGTELVLELPR
jgi:signal transduction histidine kinase